MASYYGEFRDITYNSATFVGNFTGGDSGFAGVRFTNVTIYLDGEPFLVADDYDYSGGGSSSFSIDFSGLSSGTRYTWIALLGYTSPGGSPTWVDEYTAEGYFYTESIPIEPWSWYESSARMDAYDAITSRGKLNSFSYTVWNELVDKVSEILLHIGHDWDYTYDTLSGSYMSSSDRAMTAVRYNSLRNNIRLHYTVSASRYPLGVTGETIKGSYFVTIGEVINEWIEEVS